MIAICGNEDQEELKVKTRRISIKADVLLSQWRIQFYNRELAMPDDKKA